MYQGSDSGLFGLMMLLVSTLFALPALSAPRENSTSGFTATISNVSANGRVASIQFTLKNIAQQRQYFYIITGSDGSAALSSGEILPVSNTSGAKKCGNNFDLCNGHTSYPELKDYNNLTYIEPEDSTVITVQYQTNGQPIGHNQAISFPLILAVRTASANSSTAVVEVPPGPVHVVHFNFPRVQLPN